MEKWIEVSSKEFVDFLILAKLEPIRGYSSDRSKVTVFGYSEGGALAESEEFSDGNMVYRVIQH